MALMRLLVTGSTGFLGKHLMRLLAHYPLASYEVVSWSRETMGDVLLAAHRQAALSKLEPDAVIHLAWSSTLHPGYREDSANAMWGAASIDFMHECAGRGIRFFAIGSAADTPGDPTFNSPYSTAKRAYRLAFSDIRESCEMTWLRPQYVVSLEDQRPSVVRAYLDVRGRADLPLKHPEAELDFVHVGDVVKGIRMAVEHNVTGIVNLGSGYLHSVQELLAAVDRQLEGTTLDPATFLRPRRSSTATDVLLSLGWRPTNTQAFFADTSP